MTQDNLKIISGLFPDFPKGFSFEQYQCLMDFCIKIHKDNSKDLLIKAVNYARYHHGEDKRASGELFINHPLATAEILIRDFKIRNHEILAAALLHDLAEDVEKITINIIYKEFNSAIAKYVDGCTKLNLKGMTRVKRTDMTHGKFLKMASKTPEILLIKLADRIHNMETLQAIKKPGKQQIKALETIEVYAPLAAKFNLVFAKRKLYQISLMYMFPKQSRKLIKKLNTIKESEDIKHIQSMLEKQYSKFSCKVDIRYRTKTLRQFYSPERKKLDIESGENIIDFTIILNSPDILNCYKALGVINSMFTPVPKSIRDFIANPKLNGYKSLHIRALYNNKRYLFKIRTDLMDVVAQRGILLYWDDKIKNIAYKDKIKDVLKDLGEYQGAPAGRKNLLNNLPEDSEIFVYTPGDDIHYLPQGSCVLDYAFRVHTKLGEMCSHALINNIKKPLHHVLKDNDVVRIVTSDSHIAVDSRIESACKTPKAKNHVHRLLKEKRQKYAEEIGKSLVMQQFKRYADAGIKIDVKLEQILSFLEYRGYKDINELLSAIGQDKISSGEIFWEISGNIPFVDKTDHQNRDIITIAELDTSVHKFSKCCNPLPGIDPAITILSERGLSIHKQDCTIYNRAGQIPKDRIHSIKWDMEETWENPVRIDIRIKNTIINQCFSLLKDLDSEIIVSSIHQNKVKNISCVDMSIIIKSFKQALHIFKILDAKEHISLINFIQMTGPDS